MAKTQIALIRIYIGIDFIHHFAEKFGLLGREAYEGVSGYFAGLGFAHPHLLLLTAGLCELCASIAFTFGLFTRVAAVGTAAYLLVAAAIGGHFGMGFTWANPGGGWEYPLFWAAICLSFVLTGGGRYSLDHMLRPKLPQLAFAMA